MVLLMVYRSDRGVPADDGAAAGVPADGCRASTSSVRLRMSSCSSWWRHRTRSVTLKTISSSSGAVGCSRRQTDRQTDRQTEREQGSPGHKRGAPAPRTADATHGVLLGRHQQLQQRVVMHSSRWWVGWRALEGDAEAGGRQRRQRLG